MTVFLPALTASRTSIQVISSIQTVSGGVSGFGVSTQLYGLVAQLPPPALRGSIAARCASAAVERAVQKARTRMAVFIAAQATRSIGALVRRFFETLVRPEDRTSHGDRYRPEQVDAIIRTDSTRSR